jgi:outer membrane protein OmpA-like peptidoglycan-associated protein
MSRKLLYLLGILLTILIGTILHWLLNCNCGQKSGAALSESSEQAIVAVPGANAGQVPAVVPDTSGQYALVKFREGYNADPLVLYFATGKNETRLTTEEQQRIAEIADYMKKVPEAVVTITGHSDITGGREGNVLLAMERARFAGARLVERSVPESRTEIASRGPDEPAADNGTPEGRALNRRTVILIK